MSTKNRFRPAFDVLDARCLPSSLGGLRLHHPEHPTHVGRRHDGRRIEVEHHGRRGHHQGTGENEAQGQRQGEAETGDTRGGGAGRGDT
jgi:hypothetical protein